MNTLLEPRRPVKYIISNKHTLIKLSFSQTSKRPPILAWPVEQVSCPDDDEPDNPEPEGESVEEEEQVHLGHVLDGEASENDERDGKSDVEDDQQGVVDAL